MYYRYVYICTYIFIYVYTLHDLGKKMNDEPVQGPHDLMLMFDDNMEILFTM